MPLMRALSDWHNGEHEGWVSRGDEFEATDIRALDLFTGGLAVYAVSETHKIKVTADPPETAQPEPDPAPASPRPPKRKR